MKNFRAFDRLCSPKFLQIVVKEELAESGKQNENKNMPNKIPKRKSKQGEV